MAKVKVRPLGERQARVDTLTLLFAYVMADEGCTDANIDSMIWLTVSKNSIFEW